MTASALQATSQPPTERGRLGRSRAILGDLAALSCITLAVFGLVVLQTATEFDELYHVLAAESWLQTGEFAIQDGRYARGALYTVMVAYAYDLFGQSMAVARTPSLLAGFLTVVLAFLFVRHRVGRSAAWICAGLLIASPFVAEIVGFARFYAPHMLFVLIAAFSALASREALGRVSSVAFAALAALAALMALAFQIMTIVPLLGIALWLFADQGLPVLARLDRRTLVKSGVAALIAGAAVLALAWWTGVLVNGWERINFVPPWQSETRHAFWFYHFWLLFYYPTLWSLFPVLALFAWRADRRLVLLCLCIAVTGLVVHSIVAQKAVRYVAYLMPYLLIPVGVGLSVTLPLLVSRLRDGARFAADALGVRMPGVTQGIVVLILAFALLSNTAFLRVGATLVGIRMPPQPPIVRWDVASEQLTAFIEPDTTIVATDELNTIYHVGRADVTLSKSRLREMHGREFDRDYRTGMSVISEHTSLRQLMRCRERGLVLSTRGSWRAEHQLDMEVAALIERDMTRVPLDPSTQLVAYSWHNPKVDAEGSDCAGAAGDVVGPDQMSSQPVSS